jgi:hypothetical protein
MPSKKLWHNSNLTFLPLTVNTSKCRENPLPQMVTTLQMTPLATIEDQMDKATIGLLSNLATATAADGGVVAALTQANARLAKQLEENSTELRELNDLLKKERSENRGQRSFNP